MASKTPMIDAILARAKALLPVKRFKESTRESVDMMPLAKYLGHSSDRLIRDWIIYRKVNPNGEAALKIQEWCDLQEHGAKFPTSGEFA